MLSFLMLLLACGSADKPVSSDAATDAPAAQTDQVSSESNEWYPDADDDGYGDATAPVTIASGIDGATAFVHDNTDCKDTEPGVHPGATERCNGEDDNCDGVADNAAADEPSWYLDADGDGFGTAEVVVSSCDGPSRFVNDDTDCDDTSSDIHPGTPESCNSTDDDCDGAVDEEPQVGTSYYYDADGDGAGGADEAAVIACERPSLDMIPGNTDCDDTNVEIHHGAPELCNGIDDDCDGEIDDHPADGEGDLYYPDFDLDGYGSSAFGSPARACSDPLNGSVIGDTDCADFDPAMFPGAEELCNNLDDNCDGMTDEGLNLATLYPDTDNDGFGDPNGITVDACPGLWGYVLDDTDCDDTDTWVNPSVNADRDGYDACTDCDDYERTAYPGATEVVNGIDDDCDGIIDETTAE